MPLCCETEGEGRSVGTLPAEVGPSNTKVAISQAHRASAGEKQVAAEQHNS
jgi:hypothetical protein